jgi:ethanolamine ammonia-lyase small subunit
MTPRDCERFGLFFDPEGVRKLGYLVEEALRLGYSGVGLKDRMAADYLPFGLPESAITGGLPES